MQSYSLEIALIRLFLIVLSVNYSEAGRGEYEFDVISFILAKLML